MANPTITFDAYGPFNDVSIVKVGVQGNHPISKPPASQKIFVIDVSGSMGGAASAIINNVIPDILVDKNEQVNLITFSSDVIENKGNAAFLRQHKFTQGGTYMKHIPWIVSKHILSTQSTKVIMISDGDVNDKESAYNAAVKLRNEHQKTLSNRDVEVMLIRLMTSSYANPDTKALLSIGCFSMHTQVVPIDVQANDLEMLRGLLSSFLGADSNVTRVTVQTDQPVLKILPYEEASRTVSVRAGGYFLVGGDKVPPLTAAIDDTKCELVQVTHSLENEAEIKTYLELLNNRTRLNILNNDQAKNNSTFEFINMLDKYFVAKECVVAVDAKPSMHQRWQLVRAQLAKEGRVLINEIAQLKNMSSARNLNSQQMASFLRQGNDSRAFKHLAKRIGADDAQYERVMRDEVRAWQMQPIPCGEVKANNVGQQSPQNAECTQSFYSLQTMDDMLAERVSIELVSSLNMETILTLYGAIGLPFRANSRVIADAWIFRMDELYVECALLQPDLWVSKIQGAASTLQTPGTKRDITGVLPLPLNEADEQAMELFCKWFPNLHRLQCAASMMGIVADLPFCSLAMLGAGLLCLAGSKSDAKEFTSLEKDVITRLSQYATKLLPKSFEPLRANFTPEFWIGANDVTGVLKPLLVWVEKKCPAEYVEALTFLELRWRVKSRCKQLQIETDYHKVVHELLGISSDNNTPVGALFEPENPAPYHYDKVDLGFLVEKAQPWILSSSRPFANLATLLGGTSVAKLPLPHLAVMVVQILYEPDKVVFEHKDPTAYVQFVVREIHRKDYEKRLKVKHAEERIAEMDQMIQQVLDYDADMSPVELAPFLTERFENRSADGFNKLWNALCDEKIDVCDRTRKLCLVITGHDVCGKGKGDSWCGGQYIRLNTKRARQFFSENEWFAVLQFRISGFKHRYRESGKANRHGYSNDCPSFWALGYTSPDEMCDALGVDKWNEYVQQCFNHGVIKAYLA